MPLLPGALLMCAVALASAESLNILDNFNDLDGAFVVERGVARRSGDEGIYSENRHYITTTRSDYLAFNWTYEVTFRSPTDGPPDILFIGIGSGRPDSTYFNEPANSLTFRIHQGWIEGRVDVAGHPTGPEFTYFAEAIGALPGHPGRPYTDYTARISKTGDSVEFSICELMPLRPGDSDRRCEPQFSHSLADIAAAAPFLSVGNSYLFFGNGSGTYSYTKFGAMAPLQPHVVVSPESTDFPAQLTDIKFGEAVAIRNGIAFVGIPKAADGGHVALLNLTASGWKRVGTVKLPGSVANNIGETEFGRALTWRDGVLIVGGKKAAYYFSRSNGIWTFRDVLRPPFVSLGSAFPVALRYEGGDADIVGSPGLHGVGTLLASEFGASCCPSRVHIFHLSPTRQSFLYVGFVQPADSRAGDNFGADLSMTSREFVVGSPRGSRSRVAGLPAYNQSGAAYIFRRGTDGRWKQGQKLLPSEPAPGFGTSVAIDNDMIIVGAPKIDIEGAPAFPATADGHTAGGAAYVFVPGAGRYVQARKLRPRPDELFQYQDFGYRVAIFGPNVAIAAAKPYAADGFFPFGLVVAYARDGTSLQLHGIAQGHVVAASMALANNWLLLGVPYERSCPSGCVGSAHIYDVNRLAR
jgi:hypothetical protein